MFDIDGVLASFLDAYRQVEVTFGQTPTTEARWDAYWKTDVWAYIKRSEEFWLKVPPLATPEEFARIYDLSFENDLYFVTNRPGKAVKWQTERWLEMRGVRNPTVIISGKKGEMARALGAHFSIDDKAPNAVFTQYWSPETKSFLLDAPYNQFDPGVMGSKVIRVKTVNDFLDEVSR